MLESSSQSASSPTPGQDSRLRRRARRVLRWTLRSVLVCAALVGAYFGAAELGMRIGVQGDAPAAGGAASLASPLVAERGTVDVYFVTNGVHVDVWVPARHAARDWSTWLPSDVPVDPYGYVAFGWGDRGFFLDVPTWDDLTVGVALRALIPPSPTAMHVSAFVGPPRPHDDVHGLRVSADQYTTLARFIEQSFALDAAGGPRLIDHPGYQPYDRFFEGRGSYHLFRTCNVWTNDAVKAAGHEAALWAPFERGVRHHLPKNRGVLGAD